jgi:hypothetical protein
MATARWAGSEASCRGAPETIYDALSTDARQVTMQLFLRLVLLGRGATESRRRLALAELASLDLDPVVLSMVLDAFGQRRLLSFDRDAATGQATVEVAPNRSSASGAGWRAGSTDIEAALVHSRRSPRQPTTGGIRATRGLSLTGTRLAEFEAWSAGGRCRSPGVCGNTLWRVWLVARRRKRPPARRSNWSDGSNSCAVASHGAGARHLTAVCGVGFGAWGGRFRAGQAGDARSSGRRRTECPQRAGFDRAVGFGLVGEEFCSRIPGGRVDITAN